MKRLRSALLAAALLVGVPALLAARAPAQTSSGLVIGIPNAKVLSQTSLSGQVSGQLVVSFQGDSAAGCATHGLCPYSGTIVVRPRSVSFDIVTLRRHGRIGHLALLSLDPGDSGLLTVAQVERSVPGEPPGECVDAPSGGDTSAGTAAVHGSSISIGVLNPSESVLSTRCAGPLDRDVASAGPRATISLAAVLRGRTKIDLSGTRSFAAHGFAGTVSSTLVLSLHKSPGEPPNAPPPPPIAMHRIRLVTETLRLVGIGGQITEDVRGTADPVVCRLLDSCGAAGTLTLTAPAARGAHAELVATGPASRPYRDFLTALRLSHAGRARGINVGALISVAQAGEVTADFTAPSACTDTAADADLFISGAVVGHVVRLATSSAPWRTRCPGPRLQELSPRSSGAVSLSAIGRRTFTVAVRPRGSVLDDGYSASLQGRLALRLRRGRVTQQVLAEPVP